MRSSIIFVRSIVETNEVIRDSRRVEELDVPALQDYSASRQLPQDGPSYRRNYLLLHSKIEVFQGRI